MRFALLHCFRTLVRQIFSSIKKSALTTAYLYHVSRNPEPASHGRNRDFARNIHNDMSVHELFVSSFYPPGAIRYLIFLRINIAAMPAPQKQEIGKGQENQPGGDQKGEDKGEFRAGRGQLGRSAGICLGGGHGERIDREPEKRLLSGIENV